MMRENFFLLTMIIFSRIAEAQIPVIVHETFDVNRYGWHESQTRQHKVGFKDGKYSMETPETGWMSNVAPYLEVTKDYSIEATFTQVSGNDDNGVGLVWGGKEHNNSFTFTSNGFYRISSADPSLNISNEWHETDLVKPIGKDNKLKVEHRNNLLHFYINGKLVSTTKNFPWTGKYVGFVSYTKMHVLVDDFILANDIHINLIGKTEGLGEKENLGPNINSRYDEVSPKISADGKILYFGRKHSPENVGGVGDKEDIWESKTEDGVTWSKSFNLGSPINTELTNNLIAVSTDNNTFLFHINDGFAFMHRTHTGWSEFENIGVHFKNESHYLEGCLSPDGKAIIFVARMKTNAYYKPNSHERDIYVCLKQSNGSWSNPIHTGKVLNSAGDEYAPFMSADGKTLYFGTNGRPGYGDVDIFMSKRLSDDWKKWSVPVNLGLGINTVGFDAYYTLPASGEFGYMVSNINTLGLTDIIRFKQPLSLKPDPVVLISGKVLNAKNQKPLPAMIRFDDLSSNKEVGEARVNPKTGEYKIALPAGKNYGYHAAAAGFLSVNENLELVDLKEYTEIHKDLFLVPIAIGESIKLKNVFFVQSKSELMPESYPELNRLVKIMKDNPTIEIELSGHTDSQGNPSSNLELSETRVVAVKDYLVSKGIVAKRISGKGYGGSRPIAPSDTEENRQLNRRVEFTIVKIK
jgi:outer membrane protein OmpA-like peptidoglycan-associated protein